MSLPGTCSPLRTGLSRSAIAPLPRGLARTPLFRPACPPVFNRCCGTRRRRVMAALSWERCHRPIRVAGRLTPRRVEAHLSPSGQTPRSLTLNYTTPNSELHTHTIIMSRAWLRSEYVIEYDVLAPFTSNCPSQPKHLRTPLLPQAKILTRSLERHLDIHTYLSPPHPHCFRILGPVLIPYSSTVIYELDAIPPALTQYGPGQMYTPEP